MERLRIVSKVDLDQLVQQLERIDIGKLWSTKILKVPNDEFLSVDRKAKLVAPNVISEPRVRPTFALEEVGDFSCLRYGMTNAQDIDGMPVI